MVTIYNSCDGIIIMKTVNHSFPVRPILRHIPRRTSLIRNATAQLRGRRNKRFLSERERERETPFDHTPCPFSIASKDRSISRCKLGRWRHVISEAIIEFNFPRYKQNGAHAETSRFDSLWTNINRSMLFISKRELDDKCDEFCRRCMKDTLLLR